MGPAAAATTIFPPAPIDELRWVLLPGLDGSGTMFRDFLGHVPDSRAVVVRYPDEPSWTLDDYARHARNQLPARTECIVVAESFSGPVALRLLRDAPAIKALVLVASFLDCPHPLLPFVPKVLVSRLQSWLLKDALLRAFCLGDDASDDALGALRRSVEAMPPALLRARLALLQSLDERDALRAVRVPMLVLQAREDRLVLKPLLRYAGAATTAKWINGPHFLLQSRPAECWRAIETWGAGGLQR